MSFFIPAQQKKIFKTSSKRRFFFFFARNCPERFLNKTLLVFLFSMHSFYFVLERKQILERKLNMLYVCGNF